MERQYGRIKYPWKHGHVLVFRGSNTVHTTQQCIENREDAIGMEKKHIGVNVYEERRYTKM